MLGALLQTHQSKPSWVFWSARRGHDVLEFRKFDWIFEISVIKLNQKGRGEQNFSTIFAKGFTLVYMSLLYPTQSSLGLLESFWRLPKQFVLAGGPPKMQLETNPRNTIMVAWMVLGGVPKNRNKQISSQIAFWKKNNLKIWKDLTIFVYVCYFVLFLFWVVPQTCREKR